MFAKMARTGRTAAVITLTTATAIAVLAAPAAQAKPERVPVWPSLTGALPAALLRPATTTTDAYKAKMSGRINERVRAAALGSSVSVRVEDLATGQVDYGYRGAVGRSPASTMKTATALAVLSAQGAKHRMPTTVVRGTESDAIVLVGGGDPLLSSTNLDQLAKDTVAELEAAESTGDDSPNEKMRLLVDDNLFADASQPIGWYSNYFTYYAARPSGLSRDLRKLWDSGTDAGKYFRSRLKFHGLPMVKGVSKTNAANGAVEVADYQGHTISEALWPMLQYSDNSIAENMIRHVALARGAATTTAGSAAAVAAELTKLGVAMGRSRILDGSGLSAQNRLSPKSLVGIVRASMDPERPDLSAAYRNASVPTAGASGTLSSRYKSGGTRCAARRVMAKTGTLSDVVALSGVASSNDGRPRAFAIVVNNKPYNYSSDSTRYAVDRIVAAITGCG